MADNFSIRDGSQLPINLESEDLGSDVHRQKVRVAALTLPSTVLNGQKAVTTAGTAVALAATTPVLSVVMVKALAGNTGSIYVGDSSVDSTNGYELAPGDSVPVSVDDLANLYIDSDEDGEGVSYVGS